MKNRNSSLAIASLVFALLMAANVLAQAPATVTTLYRFTGGTDGSTPQSSLLLDAHGNLYGTTVYGGANCTDSRGCGTIFRLNPTTGKYAVLHRFRGPADGLYPLAGLVRDAAGNLFGTTSTYGPNGGGTVFMIDSLRQLTTMHAFFGGATDGYNPRAGVFLDSSGFIYGTTDQGGTFNLGTVFKINGAGDLIDLYSFTGMPDGALPEAALSSQQGLFYSTTFSGGANNGGSIFSYSAVSGAVNVVHSFAAHSSSLQTPFAGVIPGLYGTTPDGGDFNRGMVYKANPLGRFVTLYSFKGSGDGQTPYGGLVRDKLGIFYGTTNLGGAFGVGTVFKLDTSGNETVLYNFSGGSDGGNPSAGLIIDSLGNLYGTTSTGGDLSCGTAGCGVVFKITP